jgi:hypothetical protein
MVRFLLIIFACAVLYSGPQGEIFRAEPAAPVFSGRPVLPRLRSSPGRFMALRFSGNNPDGPDGRRLRSVEGADILNYRKSQDSLTGSFCPVESRFLQKPDRTPVGGCRELTVNTGEWNSTAFFKK